MDTTTIDFRSADPVLRLLPDEVPDTFATLPFKEQRIRGRYFLMVWSMYRDVTYSWYVALNEDEPHSTELHETVKTTDDGLIMQAVRQANSEESGLAAQ